MRDYKCVNSFYLPGTRVILNNYDGDACNIPGVYVKPHRDDLSGKLLHEISFDIGEFEKTDFIYIPSSDMNGRCSIIMSIKDFEVDRKYYRNSRLLEIIGRK
jgi:hypothetical protein